MKRRKILRVVLGIALLLGLAWLLVPKPPLLDGVSFSREVFDRHGNRLAVTLSADDKYRIRTPLEDISPALIAATLRHEDRWFQQHPGINPVALVRSTTRFLVSGRQRIGASTITMQLARLRFGLHTRSISGKIRQIFCALAIERHYSKDEILEAYLNLAPYGRNLEGVGAASLAFFRQPPAALGKYEALALSVIPQSPARRTPRRDRINTSLQSAMRRAGDADAENFNVFWRGIPQLEAPHFARRILRETSAPKITSSLDREVQRLLQKNVSVYLKNQRRLDLKNAAVQLFDWQKGEIVAHLGSANFYDASIHGQVDGTRALRSPGSTLKPFIYALAMQQGLIHPDSIVLDAPRSFAGFNPENSDREFQGPIRAADALARSRNVPAVELTQKINQPGLYDFLQSNRCELPKPSTWYGLSLPLGGAEVRLEDLVRIYALLPNRGQLLLTPESAFLTMEMLGRVPPPEGYALRRAVYWKTGTSHGYRDAWSVGICGPYVLAVWVGNFNGRANPALLGRTAAAPLFFQILEDLQNTGRLPEVIHAPLPGANLRRVSLCPVSGQLPSPDCPPGRSGWYMPGVSSISTCAVHREIIIDRVSGLRLSSDHDSALAVRREVFEFWPQDIQKLFASAGLPRRQPPPFAPGQNHHATNNGTLKIRSPRHGGIYTMQKENGANRELALQIDGDPASRRIFWFAGTQFLGSCTPDRVIRWRPTAGVHEIIAIDQDGRQATASVRIESLGNG